MLLTIAFWVFIGFVVLWIFPDLVTWPLYILQAINSLILNKTPDDFQAMYGEWAVVTGSTDGIGKAYAKELAARNMNLILISRSIKKLEDTKQEILLVNPNVKVDLIVADFSEGKSVYDKIKSHLQDVNVGILVNNVGKMYEYPMFLGEVPEQDLWDIININVGATTMMTRLVIGQMQERRRGAIVNVSSGSELQPLPLMTVYAATKVYIRSFSDALRAEYSRFGINVQHLLPLFVNTKMNAYSQRLQITSLFVPDATTYARNAVATLGKMDSSTGYWAHSIQAFFVVIAPVWIRTQIGKFMNENFRQTYIKQKIMQKVTLQK